MEGRQSAPSAPETRTNVRGNGSQAPQKEFSEAKGFPTPPAPKTVQSPKPRTPGQFGQMLKLWRTQAHMSQADLALAGNVSARHVSFMETGRARPSRKMVLRLAEVLDLPLRVRNTMLEAADYAAVYAETSVDDTKMSGANAALDVLLNADPLRPTVAFNRQWDVIRSNGAFRTLIDKLSNRSFDWDGDHVNIIKIFTGNDGIKNALTNWPDIAVEFVRRLHKQAMANVADQDLADLLDFVLTAIDQSGDVKPRRSVKSRSPYLPMRFDLNGRPMVLFSTLTHISTPRDITVEELSVEMFHPADAKSQKVLEAILSDS